MVLAVVFSPAVKAQCTDSVVGTWKLVSNTATTEKGTVNKAAFGQNPQNPSGLAHLHGGWQNDGDHFRRWTKAAFHS
jgi:hypothetical protein